MQDLRWRYLLLALIVGIAGAYEAGVLWMLAAEDRDAVAYTLPFTLDREGRVATLSAEAQAQAQGLERGDEIVAVNGVPFDGYIVFARAQSREVELEVRRAGRQQVVRIQRPAGESTLSSWQSRIVGLVLVGLLPLLGLGLGAWAVTVRPHDRQAWLLLFLLLTFPHLFFLSLSSWPSGVRQAAMIYHGAMRAAMPISMVLFGTYFAERLSLDRLMPWLKWLLIVPAGLSASAFGLSEYLRSENFRLLSALSPVISPLMSLFAPAQFACIGWFFMTLGIKSGTSDSPDSRRRLRILWVGTALAMLPMFILILLGLALRRSPVELAPPGYLFFALLSMFFFPVAVTYVVVVHRALDIRVALRQGIQYTLVSGGANLVMFLLAIGVIVGSIVIAEGNWLGRPATIGLIAVSAGAVILLRYLRQRLGQWIDRRFFRDSYDADLILSDLGEHVRTIVDPAELMHTVGGTIARTLHVPRLAFLMADGGAYRPSFTLGFDAPVSAALPESGAVVKRLREAPSPLPVYLDDPDSWLHRDAALPAERETLASLETELAVPVTVKERLLGVLSLSRKRSEEAYTRSDLRLLKSLSVQTGLALENARLAAAYAAEAAQREKLNREVEIAREVQERLFPQRAPSVPGLDIAGGCRPALGVGGDYYDYFDLPGDHLGLIIADIAGKGIAAALLMATLQALVRSHAYSGDDIAALVTRVNGLLYESSASNRYATVFFARLHKTTLEMDYVNGGHNPPLLLRADGAVETLTVGGTPVGLLPRFPYQKGATRLAPGDVLLLFTDGISEAQNAANEEWGEDRLTAAARTRPTLRSTELFGELLTEIDAFVAGAPQHDDMTMVIVRVETKPSAPEPV